MPPYMPPPIPPRKEQADQTRIFVKDNSDEDTPQQPQSEVFKQQAFGPWSTLDPATKRNWVRTNVSGGSTRSRFLGTYPPAPTIAEGKTAITGGFEFAINVVNGRAVSGYNVYSSPTNNAAVASLVRFMPQPQVGTSLNTIKFQETTTANPFYWVASANTAGKESVRIPAAGVSSPIPPSISSKPVGGGSGFGQSGGGGKFGIGKRYQL